MSRRATVQECDQAISEVLPDLPRPEQKELALLLTGVVLTESCVLTKAAAATPGPAQDASKVRRAQRLLANERLDVPRAQRRLVARILTHCQGSLHLLVDATTTGATARQPGTVTLMLAIAWHRRALPILWRTWRADEPDQQWAACLRSLFGTLAALLPAGIQITVMADRGLTGTPLLRACEAQGWHYLLRARRSGLVQVPDGRITSLAELAPRPGSERRIKGALLWPPPPTSHKRGKLPDWTHACQTNITALWRVGDPDPWLLLSDWPPGRQRCREYRRRTWEEELFRDLKGMGWHWERSRVRQPKRVERLLLVLALATLWVICLAHRVISRGQRPLVEAPRHTYSRFQLGLHWIARLVATDDHVPCTFHLKDAYAT
jgi:hypothetical protein